MRARVILLLALSCLLAGCAYFTADLSGAEVAREDAEQMDAAIRQAQETLEIFIADLAEPQPTQLYFSVLVRFAVDEQGRYEDLWLENLTYDGQRFAGTLGSTPTYLQGLALGDATTAPRENVIDWMIVEEEQIVGAFTIRVQRDRMTLRERIDLSRQLGLPIVDPS